MHPCTLYESHNCGNCAFQCAMEGDDYEKGCSNWSPCRGGHPSTANPCGMRGYDLVMPDECRVCPLNLDNQD